MAVFTRVKTWVSNEVLTASDLNGEFNNLLNNTIPVSIEDYSADVSTMQSTADPGGLGTESLATTLAGEITRLRYAIKRIVNQAQWYIAPVGSLSSLGILTANINDLAVTTGKIASNAVTRAKLEVLGQQQATLASFSTSTQGVVADIGLSISITTTGRPIYVALVPIESSSVSQISIDPTGLAESLLGKVHFTDASNVVKFSTSFGVAWPTGSANYGFKHAMNFHQIFAVVAGTYTYKVRTTLDSNLATITFSNCRLIAYEL